MRKFTIIILIIQALFLTSSCVKSLPGLEENIFEDEDFELFELDYIEFEHYSVFERNVRVHFKLNTEDLAENQEKRLRDIIVTGAANYRFRDRLWFGDSAKTIGSTICYHLARELDTGEKTKPTTFCFEVE